MPRGTGPPTRSAVVVEGALPGPLLPEPVQVDVGDRDDGVLGESRSLTEKHPVLEDRRLAVPAQVGRRLAAAGRRVQVGRQASHRLGPAQRGPGVRPPDGDRAAGQVHQHRCPGQGQRARRRHRDEHVLADLHPYGQAGHVGGGEQQVGAERHVLPGDPDRLADDAVAGRELPTLVELAVRRQMNLGHDAKHRPPVQDDCGVEQAVPLPQRGPHDDHRQQVRGRRGQLAQRNLHRCQQRLLPQQVVDGVAGQRQLREQRDGHPLLGAPPGDRGDAGGVARRFGDPHVGGAGGDPGETVRVHGMERHAHILL